MPARCENRLTLLRDKSPAHTKMAHFLPAEFGNCSSKPGFHMIVTVGDASPRQAHGRIGDSCVKWKHSLSDVSDVADQTGTVRGRIERAEMSLKPGFHMIVALIVSICRQLIGNTSHCYGTV